ncbi:hypothetical protein [Streptomyces roseolus]|uniref:hypothetical protein n=1 Tax=Streptomyces roseolus TaxID=67358 RepID=UPI001672A8D7|nr:hypothetical protein [Streptomyces roseolus]GGR18363.1 hypothetical protein GCM10010282_08160 [Streptomyces roseolus]
MRHHETSERTTHAPERRHHADPTGRYPEQPEGRREPADRPDPRTGQGRSDPGRPGSATTGDEAARPPRHSPTVAPTPPRQPGTEEGDGRRPAAPRTPSSTPPGPPAPTTGPGDSGSPTVAPTPPQADRPRPGGPRHDHPQPETGRPAHDRPRSDGPDGTPTPRPAPPRVPAQRTPVAYPQAMPYTPPSVPPGPAPAAPGGHARHAAPSGAAGADAEGIPDLLGPTEEEEFLRRWHEVQGRFVDDPRQAVHAADVLVGDVMRTLAATFARHRHTLEGQWSQGLEADTESLRLALCQYRALFQRLLST